MARAALTSSEIESFRARTVEAATRLFAEDGYDAVTMRALAAALDVSPMTPYRYFESKEELFVFVRTEGFRRFADRQAEAAASTDDPALRLRRLGRAYIQFALDEPHFYRIMFELHQSPKRTYPELVAEERRSFSYLHDAVQAAGLDGDPLTVSHMLWSRVHGMVSLHLAGKLIMGRSLKELMEAL